jgi:Holliday junction resolvase RusA-like endonuclease
VKWKREIETMTLAQLPTDFKMMRGAVRIKRAVFVFTKKTGWSKIAKDHLQSGGYIFKTTKPDMCDNLFKGLIDAMSGIVYKEDQLICHNADTKKVWGLEPRIEIEFEEIGCLLIDNIE